MLCISFFIVIIHQTYRNFQHCILKIAKEREKTEGISTENKFNLMEDKRRNMFNNWLISDYSSYNWASAQTIHTNISFIIKGAKSKNIVLTYSMVCIWRFALAFKMLCHYGILNWSPILLFKTVTKGRFVQLSLTLRF